jgi:hypothetical protein
VKHSCYFSAKTSFKFVSSKNKIRVSFCPVFMQPHSPLLFFCLNFKLSELNRLIVLHKPAQNKCYFNIVANIWPENMRNWQKSGQEKVSITGLVPVYDMLAYPNWLRSKMMPHMKINRCFLKGKLN